MSDSIPPEVQPLPDLGPLPDTTAPDPRHGPASRHGPAPQGQLLSPDQLNPGDQPATRRLSIRHMTRYDYDAPVDYGVQQIRLTPKSTRGQTVIRWQTVVTGGREELHFDDHNRNRVNLVSTTQGATRIEVISEGCVEVEDRAGVMGPHEGYIPLWLFQRATPATKAGARTRALAQSTSGVTDTLERLHALSAAIRAAVAYETGISQIDWTAEDALKAGKGVCQDHSHIFIAAARHIDVPARYVSGYLMMDDRVEQEATHAWAEAHVEGLGWVGFDISNAIAPDTRYVRVATGLDYSDAAPVSGTRFGNANASMHVAIQVQQ